MIGFTRALAREVGHDGINVNCIAPAIIRTDLYNFMPEDVRDSIVGAYPLGRVGEVEDVVSTALFLATKDGDYFTALARTRVVMWRWFLPAVCQSATKVSLPMRQW